MKYKIFALGDDALTVDFGNKISVELNDHVLQLVQYFTRNPFKGLIETVPAYSSITIFYDVTAVRKNFPEFSTAFRAVENLVENAFKTLSDFRRRESRLLEIPVCFAEEYALDLKSLAAEKNLSPEKTIEIFLARTYRVFMLGFLPGFSYMGEVDETIATPRKPAPRLKVAAGSVGIAGKQTGIYSLESPGGWQIVGRTPIELFTPNKEIPAFLQAGDAVKFYSIDKEAYASFNTGNPQTEK